MIEDSIGARSPAAPPAPARPAMLSLVICTLNERDSICALLDEVADALQGRSYEIIVVDDDSSDGTADAVTARAAADPRIRLIVRKGVRGLASAAVRGWDAAGGEVLGLMDGDGQHDPRLIPQLVDALGAAQAELAVASRYAEAGPSGLTGGRHWLSRAGTQVAGLLLRAPVTDPMSGCFVMRRSWYEAARPRLSAVGFKILVDLVASSSGRPRIVERPTALRARTGGESKLDARVIADLGALVAEKWTGGLIPARFVLFAVVGTSGIVVNQRLFALARWAGVWPLAAILVGLFGAMAWNFGLNNLLTFRDQRLRGRALVRGFAGFCLACTAGAAVNFMTAAGLHHFGVGWGWATLTGALIGGVWNFWAIRHTTWHEARA